MESSEKTPERKAPDIKKEEDPKDNSFAIEVPLEKGVISRIIKALRNIRNYSQTRLGRMLGVQKTQISKLEKGDANITIGTMFRVITALKASISFKIKVDSKKEVEVLKEVLNEEKEEPIK